MAEPAGRDLDAQYGLPKRQVELLRQQAAQRAIRRQYFLKETTSPFNHSSNKGYLFDPCMQRYQTMTVTLDHFKPTPTSALYGIGLMIPIVALAYIIKTRRDAREHLYRTGQVAYKDRSFKFV